LCWMWDGAALSRCAAVHCTAPHCTAPVHRTFTFHLLSFYLLPFTCLPFTLFCLCLRGVREGSRARNNNQKSDVILLNALSLPTRPIHPSPLLIMAGAALRSCRALRRREDVGTEGTGGTPGGTDHGRDMERWGHREGGTQQILAHSWRSGPKLMSGRRLLDRRTAGPAHGAASFSVVFA